MLERGVHHEWSPPCVYFDGIGDGLSPHCLLKVTGMLNGARWPPRSIVDIVSRKSRLNFLTNQASRLECRSSLRIFSMNLRMTPTRFSVQSSAGRPMVLATSAPLR